jgi:outer membrane receptor protein involved in Fe transport
MAVFAWSLVASTVTLPASALAQARRIDIPAGPLNQSLARLSQLTGASIGFAGRLPPIHARRVHRARGAADALRQMLMGSGYRVVATGPSSFRIEAISVQSNAPVAPVAPLPDLPESEIVVTAMKRREALTAVPAAIRVVKDDRLRSPGGIPGSDAVALEIPSLSMSSLGPGRNRLFLRGVGDGPLNGFNQGSVAILLDEARLTYDSPDPDWALVDIDQVEVLEGPQGPLYGTGALGGIVKLSTNHPELSRLSGRVQAGIALTQDGDLSNSQSITFNLPLIDERLGVRAVAYRQRQSGWIDDGSGANDANSERLEGARLALRWVLNSGWTVDLTGAVQRRRAADSQYVDGGLGPLERPARAREPRDLDASLGMMTIQGPVGDLELTSITSWSRQEAAATYDATPLANDLGAGGTMLIEDDRNYNVFDQEVRLGTKGANRVDWLIGASLIKAWTDAEILAEDSLAQLPVLQLKRSVTEAALFGEVGVALSPKFKLTGGTRIFSSHVEDEGNQGGSDSVDVKRSIRTAGSITLAWTPSPDRTFFVRGATAYRPGGINLQPDASQHNYDADELASIEVGSHLRLGGAWSIDASAFAARWQHVQSDELLANGLVATRNAGNARNLGVEADLLWKPRRGSELSGGFIVQSARLETSSAQSGFDDPRLPAVPHFAARFRMSQSFRVGTWDATASTGIQYVGATHLSFDPYLDRRTGGYAVVDFALSLTSGGWNISLSGQNLGNSSADTFAFGNPYRVRAEPQRTPLRPRTVGLSVSRRF